MTPALILFSGALVTLTAVLAMVFGVSLATVAAVYVIAVFALPCVLISLHWLRHRTLSRGAREMAEIEAEIIALRESAARDTRFGAGSPDALSPGLHRRLLRREAQQELEDRKESDFMIRTSR